jgi:hypothetical protein
MIDVDVDVGPDRGRAMRARRRIVPRRKSSAPSCARPLTLTPPTAPPRNLCSASFGGRHEAHAAAIEAFIILFAPEFR